MITCYSPSSSRSLETEVGPTYEETIKNNVLAIQFNWKFFTL